MHLSSRGEFGQDPSRAVGPKGLSGPPLPLLPLRIEVGWIRLPSANKRKRKQNNLINKAEWNPMKAGGSMCVSLLRRWKTNDCWLFPTSFEPV